MYNVYSHTIYKDVVTKTMKGTTYSLSRIYIAGLNLTSVY